MILHKYTIYLDNSHLLNLQHIQRMNSTKHMNISRIINN